MSSGLRNGGPRFSLRSRHASIPTCKRRRLGTLRGSDHGWKIIVHTRSGIVAQLGGLGLGRGPARIIQRGRRAVGEHLGHGGRVGERLQAELAHERSAVPGQISPRREAVPHLPLVHVAVTG